MDTSPWGPTQDTAASVALALLARYRQVPDVENGASVPQDSGHAPLVEEAFIRGVDYSPDFSYDPRPPSNYDRLELLAEDALAGFERYGDWTFSMFHGYLLEQIKWAKALHSHDPARITEVSSRRHGPISDDLVTAAEEVLSSASTSEPPAARSLDTQVAAEAMRSVLVEMGFLDWQVRVQPMVARMSVSSQHRVLRLNASVTFSDQEVRRLAVHEVACHVARSVAGERQPRPLLALGLGPRHLLTEEGLAVWLEDFMGVLSPSDKRKYALRVVATQTGLSESFSRAYAAVRPYCPPEQAYALVKRVKRGLCDTSAPGAYVKDHVYLAGWRAVAETMSSDPALLGALSAGKVSLEMAERVAADLPQGLLTPSPSLVDLARTALAAAEEALLRV